MSSINRVQPACAPRRRNISAPSSKSRPAARSTFSFFLPPLFFPSLLMLRQVAAALPLSLLFFSKRKTKTPQHRNTHAQHATCNMQRRKTHRATRNTQYATRTMHCATRNVHHATRSTQHAARIAQEGEREKGKEGWGEGDGRWRMQGGEKELRNESRDRLR